MAEFSAHVGSVCIYVASIVLREERAFVLCGVWVSVDEYSLVVEWCGGDDVVYDFVFEGEVFVSVEGDVIATSRVAFVGRAFHGR